MVTYNSNCKEGKLEVQKNFVTEAEDLNETRKGMSRKWRTKKIKENQRVFNAKVRCHKKVVYNNSDKHTYYKEGRGKFLSFGFIFSIDPMEFPIV